MGKKMVKMMIALKIGVFTKITILNHQKEKE